MVFGLHGIVVVARGRPVDEAGRFDAGVEVGVGEDGAHLRVPRSAQGALADDDGCDGGVDCTDEGGYYVDSVVVEEGCLGCVLVWDWVESDFYVGAEEPSSQAEGLNNTSSLAFGTVQI